MTNLPPITYSDGATAVLLGDHVRVRLFLILRRTGRVSYIPGVSQIHPEMEHDGIRLVGITFDGGGAGGFWVEAETSRLIKTVTFIRRDESPSPTLPPEEDWQ